MNFKKIRKRALAILISLTMVAPYATPMVAMAADDEDSSFDASYFENAASGSSSTVKMSAGSSSSMQSQLATAIAMQVSSTTGSSSTTLTSIDSISDIEVGLTANPDSYRWTAWYRKNAEDPLDTSSSSGNYYGFSLDKVKAWSEYSEEIKNLNDGKFPELQDYTYPTTTADGNLSFWADKPGVYDVYGDPHYSQVVLTAKVDVTYTTETQTAKLVDSTTSGAGYPDSSVTDNTLDSLADTPINDGVDYSNVFDEFCGSVKKGKTKNNKKAYNSLVKTLNSMGTSVKDFSGYTSKKKAISSCLGSSDSSSKNKGTSNEKAEFNNIKTPDNTSYYATHDLVQEQKDNIDAVTNKDNDRYKLLNEYLNQVGIASEKTNNGKNKLSKSEQKDLADSCFDEQKNKFKSKKDVVAKHLCGVSEYQPQSNSSLASHIQNKDTSTDLGTSSEQVDMNGKQYKIETTTTQHTKTITIAQTVLEDVYGSQLERVGTVAVGEKVGSWNMGDDSFWQTTPDYYSQDTDYLTVEAKDSDNAFETKEIEYDDDGNAIESTSSSSSGGVSSNILIFGFARESDSDVIGGEVTFANLTVQQNNLVHGYNTIPNSSASIDASIDVNNAGSKYQGKIPLVNFSVTSGETTQTSNSSLKKYVILTQDNEEATNSDSAKNEIKDTETSTKTSHSTKTTQQDGKTIITDVTTKVTTIGDKTNTSQTSN